ncbi:MAG TPA: nucleotidyltransferase domain-containing protein, partial [Thermomicrobiales bacterium]|nr:nucleotidyltransferase domain-containing protein [Thermomicrobiales bacterium]
MTRSNEIRQRGKEALRSIPGIVALYEFGSHANGTADEWSDIDFQLFSEDVDISVSGRCAPLLAIAPVMIEWTIVRTENAWASTVLFADTSPLCHLDIGISTAGSFVHDSMLSESRLHWTQKARYQS